MRLFHERARVVFPCHVASESMQWIRRPTIGGSLEGNALRFGLIVRCDINDSREAQQTVSSTATCGASASNILFVPISISL